MGDVVIGSVIGTIITSLVGAIVYAIVKIREQSHAQSRTNTRDRFAELRDVITRLEKLYETEKKSKEQAEDEREEARRNHEICERQIARLTTWAEMITDDLRENGISIRPMPKGGGEGSGTHEPLKGTEE